MPHLRRSPHTIFQGSKRIERRAGRPQTRLNGEDGGIRAVKTGLDRDFALPEAIVGLPRKGSLDPVIGRRRNHGEPIGQAIFEIASNLEFLGCRNCDEIAMRIERERRLGKVGVGDQLPVTRRQEPGAAPSSVNANACQSGDSGKTHDTRRERKRRNTMPPSHTLRGDNYQRINNECSYSLSCILAAFAAKTMVSLEKYGPSLSVAAYRHVPAGSPLLA